MTGEDVHPSNVLTAPVTAETRVYRLIEYVFTSPRQMEATLRRSLVGSIQMGDARITATIVDTIDAQQQDRLQLARRQPGVWLAKPDLMEEGGPRVRTDQGSSTLPASTTHYSPAFIAAPPAGVVRGHEMVTPNVGPSYSRETQQLAEQIIGLGGYRLAHTLALALSSITQELDANAEPEKFLSGEEALQLATALMQLIPSDWKGDQIEEPPPPPPAGMDDAQRQAARERAARVAEAAQPTAIPWKET